MRPGPRHNSTSGHESTPARKSITCEHEGVRMNRPSAPAAPILAIIFAMGALLYGLLYGISALLMNAVR